MIYKKIPGIYRKSSPAKQLSTASTLNTNDKVFGGESYNLEKLEKSLSTETPKVEKNLITNTSGSAGIIPGETILKPKGVTFDNLGGDINLSKNLSLGVRGSGSVTNQGLTVNPNISL